MPSIGWRSSALISSGLEDNSTVPCTVEMTGRSWLMVLPISTNLASTILLLSLNYEVLQGYYIRHFAKLSSSRLVQSSWVSFNPDYCYSTTPTQKVVIIVSVPVWVELSLILFSYSFFSSQAQSQLQLSWNFNPILTKTGLTTTNFRFWKWGDCQNL